MYHLIACFEWLYRGYGGECSCPFSEGIGHQIKNSLSNNLGEEVIRTVLATFL